MVVVHWLPLFRIVDGRDRYQKWTHCSALRFYSVQAFTADHGSRQTQRAPAFLPSVLMDRTQCDGIRVPFVCDEPNLPGGGGDPIFMDIAAHHLFALFHSDVLR